ncbi:MAG: hypothetical protein LBK99_09865 [Opitutaceae bacterium]|jgi:hypothetical protein|nr:hypothetical protein [Opitutaceae bacterium]
MNPAFPAYNKIATACLIFLGTLAPAFAQANRSITFANLTKTFGDAPFLLNATSNGDGTPVYSITSMSPKTKGLTMLTLAGTQITIHGSGSAKIRVDYPATPDYKAGNKTMTLTVKNISLKTPGVTILNYGEVPPYNTVMSPGPIIYGSGAGAAYHAGDYFSPTYMNKTNVPAMAPIHDGVILLNNQNALSDPKFFASTYGDFTSAIKSFHERWRVASREDGADVIHTWLYQAHTQKFGNPAVKFPTPHPLASKWKRGSDPDWSYTLSNSRTFTHPGGDMNILLNVLVIQGDASGRNDTKNSKGDFILNSIYAKFQIRKGSEKLFWATAGAGWQTSYYERGHHNKDDYGLGSNQVYIPLKTTIPCSIFVPQISIMHNEIVKVTLDAGTYTIVETLEDWRFRPNTAEGGMAVALEAVLNYRDPARNGVTWTAINLPPTGQVGKTIGFTATLKNSGTKPWASSHNARLRLGSNTAAVIQQPSLATTAAGASKTVNFSITLPSTAGTYTYYFQTAESGVEEFGAVQPRTITVYPEAKAEVSSAKGIYYTGASFTVGGIFSAKGGNLYAVRLQLYDSSGKLVWEDYRSALSVSSYTVSGDPSSKAVSAGNYTLKGAAGVSMDGGMTIIWTEAVPLSLKLEPGVKKSTVYSEAWPAPGKELWFQKSETASKEYDVQQANK